MKKKKLSKTRSISLPTLLLEEVQRRTANTPAGFSRFVAQAISEKLNRENILLPSFPSFPSSHPIQKGDC